MRCPHCEYEGELHADYLEAVWQTVDGDVDNYSYTGVTGHYDDGSTSDECLRCPSCCEEVVTFGKHVFIEAGKSPLDEAMDAVEEFGDARREAFHRLWLECWLEAEEFENLATADRETIGEKWSEEYERQDALGGLDPDFWNDKDTQEGYDAGIGDALNVLFKLKQAQP